MPKEITLPRQFTSGCIHTFVGNIVGAQATPIDNHIVFDFQSLRFIDGVGLTILSNTLEWLLNRQVICTFKNWSTISDAIIYLDDCGFFMRYLREHVRNTAKVRRTTVPLEKVKYAESHGWLDLTATPWLSDALGVSQGALGTIRACIKEVFNNVEDHSEENIACVHMQHYPNKSQVHITISDFGKGIPTNIAERYAIENDGDAIRIATQEGITTQSHPNNRGSGLSTLVDCVTMGGGRVNIYSMQGVLTCHREKAGPVIKRPWVGGGIYPGTLVNVMLRTDLFVGDDVEEVDFEW